MPELQALYAARVQACGCADKSSAPAAPDKGGEGGCRPWLKVERDEKRYEACMRIAEKIGPVDSSKKAHALLADALGAEDQEVFGAMYLDTHLQIRGFAETGRGEIDAVMAPIAPTLRLAVVEGAQAVIIFHTHPTMLTQPSDGDRAVTAAFDEACRTLNLLLVDHLIIGGRNRYYSFLDAGELK